MALNLTGGTRYVDIPEAIVEQDYDPTAPDISWMAWVYLDTGGASGTIWGCHDPIVLQNRTIDFFCDTSDRPYALIRRDSTPAERYDVRVNTGLSTGQWYHLCYTFDASGPTGRWYVDGVQAATTTVNNAAITSGELNLGNNPMRIGQRAGDNVQTLDGRVEGMRWYHRALSAGEVAAVYRSQGRRRLIDCGMHLPLTGTPGDTVALSEVTCLQDGTNDAEALSGTAPTWANGPTFGLHTPRPKRARRAPTAIAAYECPDVERYALPAAGKWAEQGVMVVDPTASPVVAYVSSTSLGMYVRRLEDWASPADITKQLVAGVDVASGINHLGALAFDTDESEVLGSLFEISGSQGRIVILNGTTLAVEAELDLVAAADATRAANIDGIAYDASGPYLWAANSNYLNRWDYDATTRALTNHTYWSHTDGLSHGLWVMSAGATTRLLTTHDSGDRGAKIWAATDGGGGGSQGGLTVADGEWDLFSRLDGGAHEEGIQVVTAPSPWSPAEGLLVFCAELDRVALRRFVGLSL